jgi:hypothetical protein
MTMLLEGTSRCTTATRPQRCDLPALCVAPVLRVRPLPHAGQARVLFGFSPRLCLLLLAAQGDGRVDILPADKAGMAPDGRRRVTSKYMTKYERARVLGSRALQLRYDSV